MYCVLQVLDSILDLVVIFVVSLSFVILKN